MLKQLWQSSVPLTITGLLMLPVLAVAIVGMLVDPRMITGAPAWLKPAKFATSIAIYVFTLAWVFTLIPQWKKTRLVVGWITATVMLLELAIIVLQVWRGTTSHFNTATAFDAVLFGVMGIGIVAQTVTSIAVAVALWRQRFNDRALGWAVRLGMTITIIGAFTGGFMTGPTEDQLAAAKAGRNMPITGAHIVGAPDGGPGLPGTGWSTEHGDLRVPHFVGLHALQVLLLIVIAMRRSRLSADAQVRITLTAAGSYIALFGILLGQAFRGHPLTMLDAPTLAIFGAWAALTAVCSWLSVARLGPIATVEGA